MAGISADLAIESNVLVRKWNFPVNVAMLSGEADLRNTEDGKPLAQVTKTVYAYQPIDFLPVLPDNIDLDGDGKSDTARLDPETNQVSMWLSDQDPDKDPPVLTRQADFDPDFTNQGLVKSISREDLRNTDIYVYRISNGQLFAARKGLLDYEANNKTDTSINYRQNIPAPSRSEASQALVEKWQSGTGINPGLYTFKSDRLRPGEQLKVIMINRATGYIGTSIATYGANTENGGIISFSPAKIHMLPPNLKIRVRRSYDVDAGSQKHSTDVYTIGFEGKGLTSDNEIRITTEWYDQDGSPLPGDLPGFTGRLAKVVAANTLGQASDQIANFPVKPGQNLVVVKLPRQQLDTAHYYIHVNGEPMEGKPNFSTAADFKSLGAGEGALVYRPSHYVPVKVPLYDKAMTVEAKKIRSRAITDAAAAGDDTYYPPVDPIYEWAYRPEMQFSLLDLTMTAIHRKVDGTELAENLLGEDDENMPFLRMRDESLNLYYSLFGPTQPQLEGFGPESDLVFGLGYEEFEASEGKDQSGSLTALQFFERSRSDGSHQPWPVSKRGRGQRALAAGAAAGAGATIPGQPVFLRQ